MLKQFKDLLNSYESIDYLPVALADVSFKFPKSCNYPSLSVRIDDFGLINPLEGRTVATLPEISLALYQGAKIEYHEAVVIENFNVEEYNRNTQDNEDIPKIRSEFVFRNHLYNLYKLRKEAKDSNQELLQQLYKTYSNSLYGKVSQGIRERSMYNSREGISKRLPKSSITNAYYASMITGLIRASLSSVIIALDELIQEGHNYKIISATTDGLLYGVDNEKVGVDNVLDKNNIMYKYDSCYEALKNNYNKFNSFEKVDPILAKKLLEFPSLRLLKISHEAWNDPEYIEIKHVANSITNIKTRGQVGLYKEDKKWTCTILAKAGHKVPGDKDSQGKWILKHYEDPEIEEYHFTTLSNIQDIMSEENPLNDLVSIINKRKISLDYDYKRYPIDSEKTAPVKDINEFMRYRQSADYLRRLGRRATIEAVEYKYKLAKQNIRKTGSNKAFCLRHILRALMAGVKPFKKPTMSRRQLAILLQEFGVTFSKINHAANNTFTPNMIEDTSTNRAIIRKVLKKLSYRTKNNYKNYLELLLHKKISNKEDVCYLD